MVVLGFSMVVSMTLGFFRLLQESFRKFDLEITCDTDTHTISENGTVSEKQDKYTSPFLMLKFT